MRPHPKACWLYFREIDNDIIRAKEILSKGIKTRIYFVDRECDIKVMLSVCLENGEIIARDQKHKKIINNN
jgi:hypothetical protein